MKLLYIADGRSPTALNWIEYFIQTGHEVHLASTYQCEALPGLASMEVIPVAVSGFYSQPYRANQTDRDLLRKLVPVGLRTRIRQMAAPLSIPGAASRLCEVIERVQPELIHAMRIPFEGMLTAEAVRKLGRDAHQPKIPFLISVWGNDFTLHARSTTAMMSHTRRALKAASGLHTDCLRDQRLALEIGFEATKPNIAIPGGGGVRMDIFHPHSHRREDEEEAHNEITLVNPRGIRAYVRNDTVFEAIRLVAEKYPDVRIICPGMQDEDQVLRWAVEFCITDKLELLPPQSRHQMAKLFRRAHISLSITTHDGTPNTLLEAMACGCFPIAGDLESIREWIEPGTNGLLVDPGNPQELANAILESIDQPKLRKQAQERNLELVQERAEFGKCMKQGEKFYKKLISPYSYSSDNQN